jgi:hypothetical protein
VIKYKINDLNRKIKLENLENNSWVLKKYVWGKIENNSNTLTVEHDILENKNMFTVIIRKSDTIIIDSMRFVYKNIFLYIKYIDILDTNYLRILCDENGF